MTGVQTCALPIYDGIPSSGNKYILQEILRKEWNFKGVVVSDWCSITEMISHGYCLDSRDAALKGTKSGVQIDMVSNSYLHHLKDLVKNKEIDIKTIDDAVRDILNIKFKLGLFDNPYIDEDMVNLAHYSEENLETAKQCAIESIVLLKNSDNLLPIKEDVKTILITGPLADAPYEQMGTWAFDGDKNYVITPLSAIRQKYGDKINVIYEPGLKYSRDTDSSEFSNVIRAAKKADIILAFVGEEAILSGEAHCLADISLVGVQSEFLSELSKTGKPLVSIFFAGRPLTIEKESNCSNAVLYAWHPGTMGGNAIADILFGIENPSGKLPITFPKMVGQIPMYYNSNNTGRPANRSETMLYDIEIEAGQTSLGCTSFWLDAGFDPLYPFGYGLSYTNFVYEDLKINKKEYAKDDKLNLSFKLTNDGEYDGSEVVQLYIRDKIASITRPVKELKGFKKVTLKKGESRDIEMELNIPDLAFYNEDLELTVESGEFDLWIGTNSSSGLLTTFWVN